MKRRKIIAALLSAAMLCTVGAPALATDLVDSAPQAAEQETTRMPERELTYGTITEIMMSHNSTTDEHTVERITISVPAWNNNELALNISAQTLALDSGTGRPADLSTLQKGDEIYAFHSPAMTKSIPPQTAAEAIIWNVPADARSAMLHTVEAIEKTDYGIRLLVDNGSLYIGVSDGAEIWPYFAEDESERSALGDVQVGDRIFAWYEIILTSYPGQTGTDRLVIVPGREPASNRITVMGPETTGTVILPQQPVRQEDTVFVPLRAVAEALGYAVDWHQADRTAVVTRAKGERTLSAKIGTDGVYLDENYRTWVPAESLETLGIAVTIDWHNAHVEIMAK